MAGGKVDDAGSSDVDAPVGVESMKSVDDAGVTADTVSGDCSWRSSKSGWPCFESFFRAFGTILLIPFLKRCIVVQFVTNQEAQA